MGKIEKIRDAIHPLEKLFSETDIYYHPPNETIEVFFIQMRGGNWDVLLHSERNATIGMYFTLRPIHPFITGREELMKQNRWIVFSGSNVFKFLGIPYWFESDGPLSDLHAMVEVIVENSDKIRNASSFENIENTYNSLRKMENNNEKEIQQLIRHLLGYWN